MIAAMIGVAVGIAELLLLAKLTTLLLAGTDNYGKITGIVLMKLMLLAAALFGTAILAKEYLVHMGIGLAVGLLTGAIIKFIMQARRDAKTKKRGNEE